jgi:Icc-related predicted phosphoesterase
MKIIAISDTHNKHNQINIQPCDLLIHTGDATGMGREREVRAFAKWFEKQPALNKIYVPGNHELDLAKFLPMSKTWFEEECPSGIMLINQMVTIRGIKIFGSPVQPYFHNWAWNMYPAELATFWKRIIPDEVDILLTHGPAYGILDQVQYADGTLKPDRLGCPSLLKRIKEVKPDIHICGHIHSGHGELHEEGTSFYNAAMCDEMNMISYPITIIEYEK